MAPNLSEQEFEFVKSCLPGKLSFGIIGLVVLISSPLMIWVGKGIETTFGKYLFMGFGVLGFLTGAMLIWAAIKNLKNPVLEALETDPSRLVGLRFMGFSVAMKKSESTYVYVKLDNGVEYPIFCNKEEKKNKLVELLVKAAPQLADTL